MTDDLKHFRATVEEYREDEPLMRRVGTTLAIVAICLLTITAHTMAFRDELEAAPQAGVPDSSDGTRNKPAVAAQYAQLLAACMNNGGISWIDPHTQHEMLTFCKTHEVKVAQ